MDILDQYLPPGFAQRGMPTSMPVPTGQDIGGRIRPIVAEMIARIQASRPDRLHPMVDRINAARPTTPPAPAELPFGLRINGPNGPIGQQTWDSMGGAGLLDKYMTNAIDTGHGDLASAFMNGTLTPEQRQQMVDLRNPAAVVHAPRPTLAEGLANPDAVAAWRANRQPTPMTIPSVSTIPAQATNLLGAVQERNRTRSARPRTSSFSGSQGNVF